MKKIRDYFVLPFIMASLVIASIAYLNNVIDALFLLAVLLPSYYVWLCREKQWPKIKETWKDYKKFILIYFC